MRISLDAHALGRRLTGNEVYIRSLINEFRRLDPHSEFIAYRSPERLGPDFTTDITWRHISANPYRRLGLDLSRRIQADRPDILHVQYTAPLFIGVPIVVTVHDVSFLEHPEFFRADRAAQLRFTVSRTMERAKLILTPSEFSRRAILRTCSVDPQKIRVIPNGVSTDFQPADRRKAAQRMERAFRIAAPFVLTAGDLQPRKNQVRLIRAFECLIRATGMPHHLVCAGQDGFRAEDVRAAAARSGVADRIHFPGYVEDGDLLNLYNACDLFIFPSLYEGFGLPILEAMACGRPVACSNSAAMPEVAGRAGILFEPRSIWDMSRAMERILCDRELRHRMEREGLRRAAQFRWKSSAESTLNAYFEAAGNPRRIGDEARLLLASAAG